MFTIPILNRIWDKIVEETNYDRYLFDKRDLESIDSYVASMEYVPVYVDVANPEEYDQYIEELLLEEAYHVQLITP